MEENKNLIDKACARIFARAIYKDIADYIQSHQEEYQKFLLEEENNAHESKTTY